MDRERFNDHISQGIALMTEQKYESAKREFEAAIQIDVKSYDAYIHLGNACANLGQFDDALAAFKNALVVEGNSGEALYSIACIARKVLFLGNTIIPIFEHQPYDIQFYVSADDVKKIVEKLQCTLVVKR